MARPLSWLPRLNEIRKSVLTSVRSHYSAADLRRLFQLQPRAANNLVGMLPRAVLGGAHVVRREELLEFLDRISEAEDVTAACIEQRSRREKVTRESPRIMVLRDSEPIDPALLSPWIERGRFKGFDFEDPIQVVDVLLQFAQALKGDSLEEFIRLYAPPKPVSPERELERADVRSLREEILQMEADWLRIQDAKKIA